MKKRLLSVTLALVMTLALLAGCGAGGGQTPGGSTPSGGQDGGAGDIKTGGTVIIGQSAEPITLNPDGKTDGSMDIIAQNVFSRLLKTNNNEEIILDLATGYTVSEDGLTYTFTLPENVKFHDGEPLTSDDVRFTFETILEQQCFAATSLANLESVTCPDDYTAVFQLRQMDARFLSSLAYNGVYILPRHVYEGQDWMGDDSMQTPVGTGPFKFSDWQKGVSITLERNPDFFRGPDLPYLDGVIYSYIADANTAMQSFYNGELDVLGIIAPSSELENMLSNSALVNFKTIYPSRFYLCFDMTRAPFDDLNFRLAVAHAINADDIVNRAMGHIGQKATTYVTPLYAWACNTDPEAAVPAYDLDKAKSYMEQTGLTKDAEGFYLHMEMDTYNYEPFPDMSQVIKSQLAEIGIDVKINMLEYAAWDEKVAQRKDYDVTLYGGYQGPDVAAISEFVGTGGMFNFGSYSNPKVDELLAQGAGQPTNELRAPCYKELQAVLAQDVPIILISEWLGYSPAYSYVKNHPYSDEAVGECAYAEYTYCWLDN
ncbi:MAG: hypothetical protein HFF73_03790 [Oscillospiraceae bacterium]|nr:hypothetical protein [Oscillospiraceae bacterium]